MKKLFRIIFTLAVPGLLALAACNRFEDDVMPMRTDSELKLNADNFTTQQNTPLRLNVLANDTVQVNGTLVFRKPAHGNVTSDSAGFVYTPVLNYNGPDQFYYLYAEPGRTDSALITVTVQPF